MPIKKASSNSPESNDIHNETQSIPNNLELNDILNETQSTDNLNEMETETMEVQQEMEREQDPQLPDPQRPTLVYDSKGALEATYPRPSKVESINPQVSVEVKPSTEETLKQLSNDLEEWLKKIRTKRENFKMDSSELKVSDTASLDTCGQVIKKIMTTKNITHAVTLAGITKLIQAGGTNQSKKITYRHS